MHCIEQEVSFGTIRVGAYEMRPDSELARVVHQTRRQAHTLRASAKKRLNRAERIIARAKSLCTRYHRLETQGAEAQTQVKSQIQHRLAAQVLEQLRQSLSDLEGIRMIPSDNPELRDLKEDIRKSIERAGTTSRNSSLL